MKNQATFRTEPELSIVPIFSAMEIIPATSRVEVTPGRPESRRRRCIRVCDADVRLSFVVETTRRRSPACEQISDGAFDGIAGL